MLSEKTVKKDEEKAVFHTKCKNKEVKLKNRKKCVDILCLYWQYMAADYVTKFCINKSIKELERIR